MRFFPCQIFSTPTASIARSFPSWERFIFAKGEMRTVKRFVLYSLLTILNCEMYRLVWRITRRTWRGNGRVLSILLHIQCQSFASQLYASMNIWGTRSLEPPKQAPREKKGGKKSIRCFWNWGQCSIKCIIKWFWLIMLNSQGILYE